MFALFGRRQELSFPSSLFHFHDLVTPDYGKVLFFLPFDNFKGAGTPATTDEYVTFREATLDFIEKRVRRMAEWLSDIPPDSGISG